LLVSVDCRRVDVFVKFSDIEKSVVKAADGEGDDVGSSKWKDVSSPHKVLGEGYLGVEDEMEAFAPAYAAGSPATPFAAVFIDVNVGGGDRRC